VTPVNDAPELFPASVTVAENTANGTLIATMLATDVDTGDMLRFSITGASDPGVAAIDPNTGAVTVGNTNLLNFETHVGLNPSLSLTVTVQDLDGLSTTAALHITLTDVNEAPTNLVLSNGTSSAAANVTVGQIGVSDEDIGETFSFALINDAQGRFIINPNDGTVETSPTLGDVNPVSGNFTINVQVTDSAGNTITRTFDVALLADDVPSAPPPPAPAPGLNVPSTIGPVTGADPVSEDKKPSGIETLPADPTPPLQLIPDSGLAVAQENRTTESIQARLRTRSDEPTASKIVELQIISPAPVESIGSWLFEFQSISRGEVKFQLGDADRDILPEQDSGDLIDVFTDPYKVSAAIIGSAAIWWTARAAGMLTSLLIGAPTWRAVDLVPIVSSIRLDDDETQDEEQTSPDPDDDEQAINEILMR
ncbi:MAG: cadherin domain-containing protein, partial [Burkholderiaceae bacterium]